MIKAKVSTDYKDIERIFAGGAIQKEILKVWSTEANAYVFEAWKILEMEGPLPLTVNSNGEALIDYRIYGNTEQTGTPTSENPIMPIGCGERTENLFDKDAQDPNKGYMNSTLMYADESTASNAGYRVSEYISVASNTDYYLTDVNGNGTYPSVCFYDENKVYISGIGYDRKQSFGITTPSGTAYLRMTTAKFVTGVSMLTAGSTAPESYIPYGYKLPILSNSTVTNIYLGKVATTRRIKKLVLTGEETISGMTDANNGAKAVSYTYSALGMTDIINNDRTMDAIPYPIYLSSHFKEKTSGYSYWFNINVGEIGANNMLPYAINRYLIFGTSEQTQADFKAYLAAQYAAGTPVTVWYVLAEPETAVVNEPLMKIGDYADTIDSTQAAVRIPTFVGTTVIDYDGEKHLLTSDGYELVDKNQNGFLLSGSTLRPEKMYIKYKGR